MPLFKRINSQIVIIFLLLLILPLALILVQKRQEIRKRAAEPQVRINPNFNPSLAFLPPEKGELSSYPLPEKATAQIIIKYKESALISKDEKSQSAEITEKLDKTPKLKGKTKPLVELKTTTEEQVNLNRQKFPQRAARVPKEATVPKLLLLKQVTINKTEITQTLDELRKDPNIDYAEVLEEPKPNEAPESPNDYYYNTPRSLLGEGMTDSWALRKINLGPEGQGTSGWDKTTGSKNVVVAIFGGEIDCLHPDLIKNIWVNPGEDINNNGEVADAADLNGIDDDGNGYVDDLNGTNNSLCSTKITFPSSGHETTVAGIIGAIGNNKIGVVGENWNVKLMAIGSDIKYAVDNGADIISISYDYDYLKDIFDYAYANGVIVIHASGNDRKEYGYGEQNGEHEWVIGATDLNDQKASFSNFGNRIDFTAPGTQVLTTLSRGLQGAGLFTSYKDLSAAKDKNGIPSIVFYDPETKVLKFGQKEKNGKWKFDNIKTSTATALYVSLDFDSTNQPHIVYYDFEKRRLVYTYRIKNSWIENILTKTDDQGYFASIKIGSDNKPRITFINNTNKTIKLITQSLKGEFIEEDITTLPVFDMYFSATSLALDSANNPNIAYYEYGSKDLIYGKKTDSVWSFETVDSGGNVGGFTSLVIDKSNKAHIAYSDLTNYRVKYATNFKGAWYIIAPATNYSITGIGYNSIILDSKDTPRISTIYYGSGGIYNIIYSYLENGVWRQELISPSIDLGSTQQLLLQTDISPYIITVSRNGGIHSEDRQSDGTWKQTKIIDWGNPYSFFSGTSASAPVVSGLAALIISMHQNWSIDQIYWAVAKGAADLGTSGHDPNFGWGRVDAKKTLDIDAPLVDSVLPQADISSPIDGSVINKGKVDITGTASDDNFTYYNVFYKKDSDTMWKPITWYSRTQKNNETLGTLDATLFAGGDYQVKIEAHDFYNTSEKEISLIISPDPTPTPTVVPTAGPQCQQLQGIINSALQSSCGSPNYNLKADLNMDQTVNNDDLSLLSNVISQSNNEKSCRTFLGYSTNICAYANSCAVLYGKILNSYFTSCATPQVDFRKYDPIPDLNKDGKVYNEDYAIFNPLDKSNSSVCSNYLNNTTNPCLPSSTSTPSPKLSPCPPFGDVDNDSFISQTDVDWVMQYNVGQRNFDSEQVRRADVNSDGGVNSMDGSFISQYLNNLRQTFPICNLSSSTPIPTPTASN